MVERSLDRTLPPSRKRQLAIAAIAAQIGAIAVARGVAKTDMALSDEVLQSAREIIGKSARSRLRKTRQRSQR